MYKIKCLARGKVILGDLGITLNKGDTIDLDTRFTRSVLDASHNLNTAIHKEHIAVLHKDVEKPADLSAVYALEQRLRQSILDEMRSQRPQEITVQPQTNPDLHNKIDALIAAIGQKVVKEPDHSMDDSKAIDIHTRTVERLTKGVTSQVSVQSTNKNSEVAQRAKELEDLM